MQFRPDYPNAEVAVVQLLAAQGVIDVFTTFSKPSEAIVFGIIFSIQPASGK